MGALRRGQGSGLGRLGGRPKTGDGGLPGAWAGWRGQATTAVQYVGVDHRRAQVLVAEQFLKSPDVVAVTDQLGGEGIAAACEACRLAEVGEAYRPRHLLLQDGLVQVKAVPDAGAGVRVCPSGKSA